MKMLLKYIIEYNSTLTNICGNFGLVLYQGICLSETSIILLVKQSGGGVSVGPHKTIYLNSTYIRHYVIDIIIFYYMYVISLHVI